MAGIFRTLSVALRVLVSFAILAGFVVYGAVAGAQVEGSANLSVDRPNVVFGTSVRLNGVIEAESGCQGERRVRLERRALAGDEWLLAAAVTTDETGRYAFRRAPWYSSAFRVVATKADRGTVICESITSPEAVTAVAARVRIAAKPQAVDAGECTRIGIEIAPDKPRTRIELQRKTARGWRALRSQRASADSVARARLCYGWGSIGTIPLRAVWPDQDDLNEPGQSAPLRLQVVKAPWMQKIDRLTEGGRVSVTLKEDGKFLYRRLDQVARIPASNQKMLHSMTVLERIGPEFRIYTQAYVPTLDDGVVPGDLWILGHGDPEVARPALGRLANAIAGAGVARIRGSVLGSTAFFDRDWYAPGWKPDFPAEDIPLPTALSYQGNDIRGFHITDPELRAARELTKKLKALGVKVRGEPGAGTPPGGLQELARIESKPMAKLLRLENVESNNFFAETIGKLLGAVRFGEPGTIAKGAAAITGWAADMGVNVEAHDSSGLSYGNRITPAALVKLLDAAEEEPWFDAFRASLPTGGQGTLEDRLLGIPLRAKTGTLEDVSALSGYVWLSQERTWAEFSIMAGDVDVSDAKDVEDVIVRTFWKYAH